MSYQGSNLWKQPAVKKKKQKRQTITELIKARSPAPPGSYKDESDIHSLNLQMRWNGGKRRRGRKSIKDIKEFHEKHKLTRVNKKVFLYFD